MLTLRQRIFQADRGQCVGCGKRLPANGGVWSWHAHHCLKQQWLRARGISVKSIATARLCILLCHHCHEGHTSWMHPVPLAKLPERVREACAELGPWAEDLLVRYHPDRREAA